MPSRSDFDSAASRKVACDELLSALVGHDPKLIKLWWSGTNRAFDNQTPASQDIHKVYKYLAGMLSNS